ncbi:MAG: hypothetical protein WAL56_14615 [Candidatus Sulfotelmatobacter sp.]
MTVRSDRDPSTSQTDSKGESVCCALDDKLGGWMDWIGGATEVVPFPVVLYSGVVVEANSGFLHLPSLALRAAVGMTRFDG